MSDFSGTPKSVWSFMYKGGGGGGGGDGQTHTHNASRLRVDENICVSDLEDGNQYKFLGFLETVRQEQKMFWSAQLRSFLRSMSIIWSSPCLITTV